MEKSCNNCIHTNNWCDAQSCSYYQIGVCDPWSLEKHALKHTAENIENSSVISPSGSGRLVIGYDFGSGDTPTLVVGKEQNDRYKILNMFYGEEAIEMWNDLLERKGRGASSDIEKSFDVSLKGGLFG